MVDIFSAFGLAAATGLNAYLPLLIVGLVSRYTDLLNLQAPWNIIENGWVLAALAVLLVIEMTVDKIPAVDTANDIIQTIVRPVAGAIMFAASSNVISDMSPAMAMILGLLVAGGVHATKATARPVVTATTAGIGNPVVSVAEDVVAGTTTLVAILLPALGLAFFVIAMAVLVWWLYRRRRRSLIPQV